MTLFSFDEEYVKTPIQKEAGLIIIDPGHGGIDAGAKVNHVINGEKITLVEKEINLRIATIFKEKLNEIFPNTKIILTRGDDIFINLNDRTVQTNMAYTNVYTNPHEFSLFISIHTNASINSHIRGIGFSIANTNVRNNEESFKFAEITKLEFIKIFGEDLPVFKTKQHDWLRDTNIPAFIADIGFTTNLDDVLLLYSEQGLEKCSLALVNGIISYVESLKPPEPERKTPLIANR
jgi:N-acetylmuramoyl-L-alanine amidase